MKLTPSLVYVETSFWNRLCDQDFSELLKILVAVQAFLVLGENVITEMARTYRMSRPDAQIRGRQLFHLLYGHVCAGMPVIRPTWALLIEEALHASQGVPVGFFAGSAEYSHLQAEIDKLRNGIVDETARKHIEARKQEAKFSLERLRKSFEGKDALRAILRRVVFEQVDSWLDDQVAGPIGAGFVHLHLQSQFPDEPREVLFRVASRLVASRRYRVSRALARSDMYVNWHFASHGSLPADLPDDFYHLVNSSHCDVFLTADEKLSKHARRLMRDDMTVLYCKDLDGLLDWILRRAQGCTVTGPQG